MKFKSKLRAIILALCMTVALAMPAAASMPVKKVQMYPGRLLHTCAIKGQQVWFRAVPGLTWTSSDKSVATVTVKGGIGYVDTLRDGKALIVARKGGAKCGCWLYVETPALDRSNISMMTGGSTVLQLKGTSQPVQWKSSAPSIASVNQLGAVTAVSAGNAKIYARTGGVVYTCMVTVKDPAPSPAPSPVPSPVVTPTPEPTVVPVPGQLDPRIPAVDPSDAAYVLNVNSGKIHLLHGPDTHLILEKNRQYTDFSISQLTSLGYTRCGRCFR